MKKSKISLAVASAVLVSIAGAGAAMASGGSLQPQVMAHSTAPVGDESAAFRFVVKYRDGAVERRDTAAIRRGLDAAVSRAALDRVAPATTTSSARGAVRASHLREMGVPGWNVVRTSRVLDQREIASFIRELKANPSVETVEIDRMYQRLQTVSPSMTPNDPNYQQYQWNFHNAVGGVRAESAWDVENGQGQGVVVAILDTGIVEDHLDLAANVIPGYDMITDVEVSRRESATRIPGGWDVGDWVEANYCGGTHAAQNSSWHGSHVAGTVAQHTNNGVGLAGLAHGARVMPIRVLGSCGGYGSDIADGITWASGGTVPNMPVNANPAEVLNMSLGSSRPAACSTLYQDAINAANNRGSIIVVAAGNDNDNAGSYTMASCQNVISVGATGITGAKAGYSNWGARVDLSAPGGGGGVDGNPNGYIWQVTSSGATRPSGWRLGGMAGTSMASPHVAAVAAMVQGALAANGRDPLSWSEMRELLTSTARTFPVTPSASRPIGAGILDARAALDKALEEPCNPELEECGIPATALANRVPVRGLSGAAGSEVLYSFEAVAGRLLSFATSGGSGNVSMYVSFDAEPQVGSADFTSARPGNNEAVRIGAAQARAGTYYIKLVGAAAYNGVTLEVRQ